MSDTGFSYNTLSDEDIADLARRSVRNEIYFRFIDDPNTRLSFMSMNLISGDDFKSMLESRFCVVWADMNDASPMSVDGNPTFCSKLAFLDVNDSRRFFKKVHEFETTIDSDVQMNLEGFLKRCDAVESGIQEFLATFSEREANKD